MRFKISLMINSYVLFVRLFGHTNYGGRSEYFKFDFSTLKFHKISSTLAKEVKFSLEYPITFISHINFFVDDTVSLSKKETFGILSYVIHKIYDESIEYPQNSLCFKIKNAMQQLNKTHHFSEHLFVLHNSYNHCFIGHLFFSYNEIYQDDFVYIAEKVCFKRNLENLSDCGYMSYANSHKLPDLSKYIQDDELKLPDNMLFEILHLAKLY